jgi:hypothetical protein
METGATKLLNTVASPEETEIVLLMVTEVSLWNQKLCSSLKQQSLARAFFKASRLRFRAPGGSSCACAFVLFFWP